MVDTLGVQSQVVDALIELLEDSDHIVRSSAAEALQHCPSAKVQQALEHAAADRSSAVQQAAKSSLAAISSTNSSWGTSIPVEN